MVSWATYLFRRLSLRWKLVAVVLPLVLVPLFLLGILTGVTATHQSYLGLTEAARSDLQHLSGFTLDLLDAHYQQFEVYKQDRRRVLNDELATLTNLAYGFVESAYRQYQDGVFDKQAAIDQAKKAFKTVNIGESGYIYAIDTRGNLIIHVAREGENIYDVTDENGRPFIRQMIRIAVSAEPDQVHFISYPWRNAALGELVPRNKVVAYRYFPAWNWIIATGSYIDETYNDLSFERASLVELKNKIKAKRVGRTGYIFCMDRTGTLTVHPEREGENILQATDQKGRKFIQQMVENRRGWIRYSWRGPGEQEPRMKIVRYDYFAPWDWIVAVGAYEDEFYQQANLLKWRLGINMLLLPLVVGLVALALVLFASRMLTQPLQRIIGAIRQINRGRYDTRVPELASDELGELAATLNQMAAMIQANKQLEDNLHLQSKMASLGVLSSGVAHEINNPLSVILGYASFLEGKLDKDSAHYRYVSEIKRESKRCKKIVQDLLSYARTPRPSLERVELRELLDQIVDFASNHTDMHHVAVRKELGDTPVEVLADADQLRQVAINLMLNAGAAMEAGGTLTVRLDTGGSEALIAFCDTGCGIPEANLDKIFEPFFTTRDIGTGLGLAITRQIVDLHQGRIHIDSTLGQGTTVTVALPLYREVATHDS